MQANSPEPKPVVNDQEEQRPLRTWHTPTLTVLDIEQTESGFFATNHETGACKTGS
jgi:hypothetical protein